MIPLIIAYLLGFVSALLFALWVITVKGPGFFDRILFVGEDMGEEIDIPRRSFKLKSVCHNAEAKDQHGILVCQECYYECEAIQSEEVDESLKSDEQKRYERITRQIYKH